MGDPFVTDFLGDAQFTAIEFADGRIDCRFDAGFGRLRAKAGPLLPRLFDNALLGIHRAADNKIEESLRPMD